MRIKNHSNIEIPKALWHKIAEVMKLSRDLPLALGHEHYIWPDHKKLSVTVYKEKLPKGRRKEVIVGDYVLGKIRIYPCTFCNSAYVTRIFLHEVCHAWIHQYRENIHEEYYMSGDVEERTEMLCNDFSNQSLLALGGHIPKGTECCDFTIFEDEALSRVNQFSLYFEKWKTRFDKGL